MSHNDSLIHYRSLGVHSAKCTYDYVENTAARRDDVTCPKCLRMVRVVSRYHNSKTRKSSANEHIADLQKKLDEAKAEVERVKAEWRADMNKPSEHFRAYRDMRAERDRLAADLAASRKQIESIKQTMADKIAYMREQVEDKAKGGA